MSDPVESGFVPVGGSQLYYERNGKGIPLVLVHSGFLDHRMWDPQFQTYAERYSVIRYDIRGHGRSPGGTTPYVDSDDLAALVAHLGIDGAFVLGISDGARIACGFAARSPEKVRGLILSGGAPSDLDPTQEEEARFLDSSASRDEKILALSKEGKVNEAVEVMLDAWAPMVDEATRSKLRTIAAENFGALMGRRTGRLPSRSPAYPVAEALRHSEVPMLLLCGEHDHPALEMMMGRFSRQLPHARFVKLPAADHTANLSARASFDDTVGDFLAATPPRAVVPR